MSDNQEINIDLAEHPLVNKQRKEAKDISILIIKTCIIQLDIQNWGKGTCHYGSCRWGWK
jgi:hypothetical protein